MKKKSIFKASFEESLNLLDESVSGKFAQENYQDALKKEKYRGTLKSYIWLVILTILFIIGPNWLIVALNNHLLHRAVLNINGLEPLSYEDFLTIGNKATGNKITYTKLTDDELYAYFDSIGVPRNTDGDFSKSPIKATSEGMVTFGTTVTQGYLDVPVSDFSSLTGRKPLSIQYIFEHVDDYLLGDRHPTE